MALGQGGCLGGQVTDLRTNAALDGATVTAQECAGCEVFSTTTGSGSGAYAAYHGVYVFDPYAFGPQIEQVAPADAVKLTVSKSGYVSRSVFHRVELMTDSATGRKYDMRSVKLVPWWVYSSYGYDSDADGLSNYEEARFGTDPYDKDTDGDGLRDDWEVYGGNWVDYPSLGADPLHMDLFLEIDYQAAVKPSAAVLDKLVSFWANADNVNPDGTSGITLHPLLDDVLPETTSGGKRFSCDDEWHAWSFSAWPHFDSAHRGGFFYAMLCLEGPSVGASYGGGDQGGFYVQGPSHNAAVDDMVELAQHKWFGVMAHELGHAVGLHHGGRDGVECKPNYHSIMNSAYREVSWGGNETLAGTRVDFSHGTLVDMPLDESQLHEMNDFGEHSSSDLAFITNYGVSSPGNGNTSGYGMLGAHVDWNGNGRLDVGTYAMDISNQDSGCRPNDALSVLRDYSDAEVIVDRMGEQLGKRSANNPLWDDIKLIPSGVSTMPIGREACMGDWL